MGKMLILNVKIKFTLFFSIIFFVKAESLIERGAQFPISLTLYDDNILLITKTQIVLYDSSLTSILKSYDLTESEIPSDASETYRTLACQYPKEYQGYILVFIADQLYTFDKNGDQISKDNFTSLLSDQPYYEITPIKKSGNYLYYIISKTVGDPFILTFYFYRKDIQTKDIILLQEKNYTPLNGNNQLVASLSINIPCVLMNSNEQDNIFTCFYTSTFPCQFSILSFSLENDNMTEIPSCSKNIDFSGYGYINLIRAKSKGDKTKAYIVFVKYEVSGYSAIYDINLNELYSIEQRVGLGCIGSSIRSMRFYYFERTEQFFLFFRDNDRTFRFVIMDKEYKAISNQNGTDSFFFPYVANNVQIESIIYSINEQKYILLSDCMIDGKIALIYQINITSFVTNNYEEYPDETTNRIIEEEEEEEEVKKEEEEEEVIEEKEKEEEVEEEEK